MTTVWDQLRDLINQSGVSRYKIFQDLGISQAQLSRLMHGRSGLSVENLERLVEYLGGEVKIIVKAQGPTKKGK